MLDVETVSVTADTADPALRMKAVVRPENTVGAIIDGMPMVAATPYLVALAETACFRLIEGLLDQGQIRVGGTWRSIISAQARSAPYSWSMLS